MAWVQAIFRDKQVWAEVDSFGRPCAPDRKIPIRFSPAADAKLYLASIDNVRLQGLTSEHLPPGAPADLPRTSANAAADAQPDGPQPSGAPQAAPQAAQAAQAAPQAAPDPDDRPTPARTPTGISLRPPTPPPSRLAPAASDPAPNPDRPAALPAAPIPGLSRDNPIRAWTDGACSGNPGPAGAGMLIDIPGRERVERSRALGTSTNNVGELTGVLMALEVLEEQAVPPGAPVVVYTDSQYARGVLTLGWKASANAELVADIRSRLRARPGVALEWVRGHNANAGNERADALARRGADESARRGRR